MSIDINLLSKSKRNLSQKRTLQLTLRYISFGFLFIVPLVSITLFFLKLEAGVPSLDAQQKRALSEITAQSQKTAKFLLVKKRIEDISEVIDKRFYIDKTISLIEQQIPSDVSIDILQINTKTITVSVSSSSLSSLGEFIQRIEKMITDEKQFSKTVFSGVVFEVASSRYGTSIAITFL